MSSQTEFIVKGATDHTIDVKLVQDSASGSGGDPLTGLVYNSSGLTCYYREGGTGTSTQLTLATQTVGGAHTDGGFVEIDATNMPGLYRLDLSDTIVSGANDKATIVLNGATDMATHFINVVLLDFDLFNSTPTVTVNDIAAGAITASSIASNAITSAKIATGAITSDEIDSTFVNEIWNKVCETEGSYTAQQIMSIALAALAGVTSSGGTVLETPNSNATRISATVDGSNNRTAMTLTPSS